MLVHKNKTKCVLKICIPFAVNFIFYVSGCYYEDKILEYLGDMTNAPIVSCGKMLVICFDYLSILIQSYAITAHVHPAPVNHSRRS